MAHTLRGHFDPRCTVCGRTVMQIAQHPEWPCQRATLPFEDSAIVKADRPPKKGKAV